MKRFKNDAYRRVRGGTAVLLQIKCERCENHICYYQKDGPGNLLRLYIDRMLPEESHESDSLICPQCGTILGMRVVFKKEDRPAYRLFVDAITKKRVSLKDYTEYEIMMQIFEEHGEVFRLLANM